MARIVITSWLHMQPSKRFASSFGMLASISKLTLGVALGLVPSCALDDGSGTGDPSAADEATAGDGEATLAAPVCSSGPIRCHALIQTSATTHRIKSHAAAPIGLGPPDLQAAYNINPAKIATPAAKPTVAITDAYGYPKLEADLGVYRAQYGLPPCTIANGCLKIVNQQGQTAPLPAAPPANDDWTVETALDVDMASAACPLCNILVVQATSNQDNGLDIAQNTAATLGATVISDSWGGPEQPNQAAAYASSDDTYFKHPTIAIFVAAGDAGYDDTVTPVTNPPTPTGPDYPATSRYTIAVGATKLVKDATTTRGWKESAWAVTLANGTPDLTRGAGGSACSLSTPKPTYQTASPCAFKATADIAAVGDPSTGVSVYNTNGTNPGWISVGGTSASAPFVAAIFAATGNGNQTSGAFIANNVAKLWDVTSGTNGTCPTGQGLLCTAAAGWDGPTGFGTPNVGLLMPGGTGATNGSDDAPADVIGGCSTGGGTTGAGMLLGLAVLGLRRRR
jgi:uncharacterized protein (TIGR03382 family)